ncbi:MAG: beta-ketoacyl-ACP synthase III [Eubacteriales bacterium]|nr:beta-ketoacyl-ACP synthase III [Eubacteriales bacterium]
MIKIGTILVSTGSYVPEQCLTNQMLTEMVDTSDEWIVQRTGIRERRIARQQTTAELATAAAKRALEEAELPVQKLDLIIACTATPDSYTPSVSCRVQAELQADRAFAFDVSAACSGFVYATDIVDSYFRAGKAKTALVVCAETLSRIIDYTDRTTCCLFGDGAAATVYQWSETEEGILQTVMGADGSRGDALFAEALPVEDPLEKNHRDHQPERFLKMNGKEVFRFAARTVPEAIDHVLEKAGMRVEEIDWVVPHQANLRIIDVICRRYGLREEQVYVNLDRYGNTSSVSIPLCLDEMRKNGLLQKGQTIIFVGFGGGLTYGAVLMRI